jgi:arylformamidase
MLHFETIYDISLILGQEAITYPGDTPFSRKIICEINDGSMFCNSRLVMSAHSGTHLDMPAHFIAEGKTIDNYQIENFIIPAQVIEIQSGKPIQASDLDSIDIHPKQALLFKTDNSISGRSRAGVFSDHFVYLTPGVADLCVEKQVSLVGIDYITVDDFEDKTFQVHRILLGNNILILESINLKEVPPGSYTLVCLPLKIKAGEASPVRAVLFR